MVSKKNTAFKSQIFRYLKRKGKKALAKIAKAKERENSEPRLKKRPLKRINTRDKSAQEKPSPERLKKFADYLATARSIISSLFIIGLSILLIYTVYIEIKRDNFQINSFSVPPDFEKNGLSSQVISNKLADKVNNIFEGIRSISPIERPFPSNGTTLPEVTVPSTNISLKTFINYLKPKTRSVGGEVTINGKGLNITVRVYNNRHEEDVQSETFIGTNEDFDTILSKVAEYIAKTTYPYGFASYLYENERIDEALELAQYCVYNAPEADDARGYILWGLILYNQNKEDEAIEKYQMAESKDCTIDFIYINWGLVLEKKKETGQAMEKYKRAIAVNPKASMAYNNLGYILFLNKEYDEAIKNFNKAIEIEPRDSLPYKNLGATLVEKKQYKEANIIYERAIAVNPEKAADLYMAWGWALTEAKDYDNAVTKYQKIIRINQCDSKAYNAWGYALYKRGENSNVADYSDSILKYQKAVECDVKNTDVYWNWGEVLNKMKDVKILSEQKRFEFETAIALFEKSIKTSSTNAAFNYWTLAYALQIIDKYRKATVYYEKSLELDPADCTKRLYYANMLKNQGQNKLALKQYQKITEIEPICDSVGKATDAIREIQEGL